MLAKLGGSVKGKREKKLIHRLCEPKVRRKGAIIFPVITGRDALPWKDTSCKAYLYTHIFASPLFKKKVNSELLVSGSQAWCNQEERL